MSLSPNAYKPYGKPTHGPRGEQGSEEEWEGAAWKEWERIKQQLLLIFLSMIKLKETNAQGELKLKIFYIVQKLTPSSGLFLWVTWEPIISRKILS